MSGKGRTLQQSPDYTGLNIQTSSMSLPCPIAAGLTRGAPNLIDFVQLEVHKQSQGKGGLGGKQTQYTYSATIVLALSEGVVTTVTKTWVNNGFYSGFSAAGFTFFSGSTPQTPWSYWSGFPSLSAHALPYQGICCLAAANYNLGPSEQVPQHSFEFEAPLYNTGFTGAGDADCALFIENYLTNDQWGAFFPIARLDLTALLSSVLAPTSGDSAYQTYCQAMGWGIAPFYSSQEPALTVIARLCQITNTAPVWTGYSLKLIPFGDSTVTGNGVTYNPPTTSTFALTDGDYIVKNSGRKGGGTKEDPVKSMQEDWFDAYNRVAIEVRDRAYDYNTVPIDWIDQATTDGPIGPRPAPVIQGHEICHLAMAYQVVSLIGQRMVNVLNLYQFTVGDNYSRMEPMDVGTITDSVLGLNAQAVRIREIEEQDDGTLVVIVEEFFGALTTGTPAGQTSGSATVTPTNTLVAPQSINAPIIFEPNSLASAQLNKGSSAPIVVIAASAGPSGTFDPNWGGAIVNVSRDGTTYVPIGQIEQPAPMGPLTANLASFSSANPDNTNTLSVNLAESGGTLDSATDGTSAANGATLGVIQDSLGGTYELLGPQTATPTGTNTYNLTTLYRGLFGTSGLSHTTGALYARLDQSIFIYALPPDWVGVALKFKFQSINIFGKATQALSACTEYDYTPIGTGFGGGTGGVPTTPTGLAASAANPAQLFITCNANPVTDNVIEYIWFAATGLSQPFSSATQIGTSGTPNFPWTGLPASTGYTLFVEAKNAIGVSAHTAGYNATTSSTSFGGGTATPTANGAVVAGPGYMSDVSGAAKVVNADATDGTKPANCWISAAAAGGASILVYLPGQFIPGLSLSPGATYWLAVGGGTTTTPPSGAGNSQQTVGVVDDTGAKLFLFPGGQQLQ